MTRMIGLWAILMLVAVPVAAQDEPPDFTAFGWGLGLAFTDNLKGADLVKEEDVIVDENGILRVQRSSNVRARMVAETHYVFPIGAIAVGPFIAIEPGDNLIQAAGSGVLVEFGDDTGPTFNIGIGVMVEFNASRLAEGYESGKPSPTADPQFLIREEATLLIMTTVGF